MIPIFWQTLEMFSCGIRAYVLKINPKFLLLNSSSSFSTKFQFPSFNFFSIWVFFHEHSRITGLQREGGGHFFISLLPPPPASQTLRHQPSDYCRELTSAHSQQPDSNREPLVSQRKSLSTKLRALKSVHST